MFIRLILLVGLLYLGYMGAQAEAVMPLGGLESYREIIITIVVLLLAKPLLGKLFH